MGLFLLKNRELEIGITGHFGSFDDAVDGFERIRLIT
jgi:hypothetical protein